VFSFSPHSFLDELEGGRMETMLVLFAVFALIQVPQGQGVPILSHSPGKCIFESVFS